MKNVVMFTTKTCPSCIKAKALLNAKGIEFSETVIGVDMLREEFMETYPGVMTVPYIIVDGVKVGGYEQLVEYISK
jgi:glutaredoxin 3